MYEGIVFLFNEGLAFLFNSSKNVDKTIETCELEKWYTNYFNKLQGSRTLYCFIPKGDKLWMKIISRYIKVSEVQLPNSIPRSSLLVLIPGMYVPC